MLYYLIMCRSLTYAQRAARALERAGITAPISKAPQNTTDRGCTYAVKISQNRISEATALLRHVGLGTGRVFLMQQDGSYQEVRV